MLPAPTTGPENSLNAKLAVIFHQMAACYRYLGPEHRFRVIAYDGASRTIASLREDITVYAKDIKTLDQLKGIGESIAAKILEFIQTGRIRTFEKLKKEVPVGLLELMDINGFGPATTRLLHEQLHINDREGLIRAIEAGELAGLRGFGAKRIENMKRGLKLFKEAHSRMLLWDALQLGNAILHELKAIRGVTDADLAGSLRRKKETIGDIDIIAVAAKKDRKRIVNRFVSLPVVERVLASGDTRASVLLKDKAVQVDIRLVSDYEYGAALLYFTGSKDHNIRLRLIAREKGWKLNEYGLFDAATNRMLAGATEGEIYLKLGMQFIAPELREERGEIDAAVKNRLPGLLEPGQIRGDMQMHSTWSDGEAGISDMADYISDQYPKYEYMVITDHSPSERIAGGVDAAGFLKQWEEIDAINARGKKGLVKKGVEVDILADGRLDLPDELLAGFDWVTAAIHSGFTKDNTDRLLKACRHPLVNCIGHPGGRLIGKREAYKVDWDLLFETAASTGTALEINAQPNRLDLTDELVKAAISKGVAILISTDAHSPGQFAYMQLGVAMARRGWCEPKHILNTLPWKQVEAFRKKKLKK